MLNNISLYFIEVVRKKSQIQNSYLQEIEELNSVETILLSPP
jgi:hypothetical protein